MGKELFVGRILEKRFINECLISLIDDAKDRSLRAFRKHRDQDIEFPRMFLFHGLNGSGKSAMLAQCRKMAQEISEECKKPCEILRLDLEDIMLTNGSAPTSPAGLCSVLCRALEEQRPDLGRAFTSYKEKVRSLEIISSKMDDLSKGEWLAGSPSGCDSNDFLNWLCDQGKITTDEFNLIVNAERILPDQFCSVLSSFLESTTLVLLIDHYESIGEGALETWMRRMLLPRIFKSTGKVGVFISGENDFLRNYRNDFPEELIHAVNFHDLPLTINNIAALGSELNVALDGSRAREIEEYSGGIPVIVSSLLSAWSRKIPLDIDSGRLTDAKGLIDDFVRKLLIDPNDPSVRRLCHLAMGHPSDANLLAALWNVTVADVSVLTNDLSGVYPFVEQQRIQSCICKSLRTFLMLESLQGSSSRFEQLIGEFGETGKTIFSSRLEELRRTIPSSRQCLIDTRYRSALLNYVQCLLWHSRDEAFLLIPGFLLESLIDAPEFVPVILSLVKGFSPILSTNHTEILASLEKTSLLFTRDSFPLRSAVTEAEDSAIRTLDALESSFTASQKALLQMLRGEYYYRNNEFGKATAAFDCSFDLFHGDPDTMQLYPRYTACAARFLENKDQDGATHALSRAGAVCPQSVYPWLSLGALYAGTQKHFDAVEALCKAAEINPTLPDVWVLLGREYFLMNAFENAIRAFGKAVDLGRDNEDIQFLMGKSYASLNMPEAIPAFQKVIALNPVHFEAHFMIGKAFASGQFLSEAVDSFNTTAKLQPQFTDAWKEMGICQYALGLYDDAAHSYETACGLNPGDSEMWYNLGLAHYGALRYEKAIEAFRKVNEMQPDSTQGWRGTGHALTALGRPDDALEAYTRVAQADPGDAETWRCIGNSLYAMTRSDEAIAAYEKAVALDPCDEISLSQMAAAFHAQNRFQEAIAAYARAAELNPSNAEIWYNAGRAHVSMAQYNDAASCFGKTVELVPGNHDAWYQRGLTFAAQGNHGEAVISLEKAAELRATDAEVWFRLGLSQALSGSIDKAIQSFKQAVSIDEKHAGAWFELGRSFQDAGMNDEAIGAFKSASAYEPGKKAIWYNLGRSQYYSALYEDALAALDKAAAIDPQDLEILYHRALVLHAQGRFAEAVELYGTIPPSFSGAGDALYNMGLAHHAQSNFDAAIELYQKVVAASPTNSGAWHNMGLSYHAQSKFTDAIRAYREAARLAPENSDIWYNLGLAFHACEHYGDAIQAYRKVVQLSPDSFEAWFNLGLAYYKWGHFNDAAESYSRAAQIAPDNASAWSNLALSLYSEGEYEKAVDASSRALSILPEDDWTQNILAIATFMTGNVDAALSEYQKLLSIVKDHEQIRRCAAQFQTAASQKPAITGAKEIMILFRTVLSNRSVTATT